ncbi:MAG: hypothetical protein JSU70_03560, partial [Phycisphaerales bacterium]
MNRKETMTGRSTFVLAMAVTILSVAGTASAWCVVERRGPDEYYQCAVGKRVGFWVVVEAVLWPAEWLDHAEWSIGDTVVWSDHGISGYYDHTVFTHAFYTPGTYTVKVQAMSKWALGWDWSDYITWTVKVLPCEVSVSIVSPSSSVNINVGESQSFTVEATDPAGYLSEVKWHVDVDGFPPPATPVSGYSDSATLTWTFDAPGTYHVEADVWTTLDGCRSPDGSAVWTVNVGVPVPHTLTISSTDGGSVTSPGEGEFVYDHGTGVTLTATPDPGYHFTNWSGSVWATSNPYELTVNHGYQIKANFESGEPPDQQSQACCLPDGGCQDLTPEQCLSQGGIPQGEDTTCATTDCGQRPAGPPVAHYKLDESIGTIAEDSAGDNHGTTYGGPVWLPTGGMMDGALSFDGVDDYVGLPIGSVIDSLTNCTFATWVDFANTGGPWQRIFDFGNNTTSYMFLTPRLSTAGEMRFGITVAGGGSP